MYYMPVSLHFSDEKFLQAKNEMHRRAGGGGSKREKSAEHAVVRVKRKQFTTHTNRWNSVGEVAGEPVEAHIWLWVNSIYWLHQQI